MLSLIESAKLNGHDPWAYLKDVFERLPTLKNNDLELLLPHSWRPAEWVRGTYTQMSQHREPARRKCRWQC